jgi:preprotein translocase subunit SecY
VIFIFIFSYLYSALVFNSNSLSEELKRSGVFIPGYKPGIETARYIDFVVYNLILPGAIFLSIQCIMPVLARKLGVNPEFAFFFGGTSLLIVVSVALDFLSQLKSITLQVRYDKFSKTV